MKKYELIVGIDLAKLTLAVCIGTDVENTKSFEIENSLEAIKDLIVKLKKQQSDLAKILVCFEHTGHCGDKLSTLLDSEGIAMWAVHPQVGHSYSTILDREKTDALDARRLFEFAFAHKHKVQLYKRPEKITLKIRELQTFRKQLVTKRTASINQLKDFKQKAKPDKDIMAMHQFFIKSYTEKIKELEEKIAKLIEQNPEIKRIEKILLSVPGIGKVTSKHLIAITDGFNKFNYDYRKLAAFVGTAPYSKQSGTSLKNKKRTSKKAYRVLKGELAQAAVSVSTRKNQFFYEYYKQKEKEGKPHLWIINSVINMILKIVCTVIKKNQLFDKEIYLKNKKSWQNNLQMS